MKTIIQIFFLLMLFQLNAQNLLEETFKDCETETFVIERDTISIHPIEDFLDVFSESLDAEVIKEIKGILFLQILVDEKGKSCLISVENNTNISTEKLYLKEMVNERLFWQRPEEKTSVMLGLNFQEEFVNYIRVGLDAVKGFHPIEE